MRNMPYIAAGLGDTEMVWLLSMGKLRTLRPRERLVEAGRAIDDLFFVTRGSFAVLLADGNQIATLSEGDVVGEMSFVERNPPSASVQAIEPSEVLGIARQAILARFAEEPRFAARFYRALAVFLSARLRETTAAAARIEQDGVAESAKVTGDRFRRLFGIRT